MKIPTLTTDLSLWYLNQYRPHLQFMQSQKRKAARLAIALFGALILASLLWFRP